MKLRTTHEYPPIPDRRWDWSAVDDDTYEAGAPIGQGPTEVAAIADLFDQANSQRGPQPMPARRAVWEPRCLP